MKLIKSVIKRKGSIKELPKDKVTLFMKDCDTAEGVWVAVDKKNKVMYILNQSLLCYPAPTWGMELPLVKEIDLYPYRGYFPEQTVFTLCEEAYNDLTDWIDEDNNFNLEAYRFYCNNKIKEEQEKEEIEQE